MFNEGKSLDFEKSIVYEPASQKKKNEVIKPRLLLGGTSLKVDGNEK